MGLEERIADLVAALDANTKALNKQAAPAKAEAEPETRGRGRPRKSDKDDDKITTDKVRAAFSEYLGVEDEKEYAKRREFVEAILSEIGSDIITEASEKDQIRAYNWLQQKLAGKKVNFDDDGGSGNGDGRRRDRSLV